MRILRPLIQIMLSAPPEPALPAAADVVHAMPDPALVVDAHGMVTLANAQATELLEMGWHPEFDKNIPP